MWVAVVYFQSFPCFYPKSQFTYFIPRLCNEFFQLVWKVLHERGPPVLKFNPLFCKKIMILVLIICEKFLLLDPSIFLQFCMYLFYL